MSSQSHAPLETTRERPFSTPSVYMAPPDLTEGVGNAAFAGEMGPVSESTSILALAEQEGPNLKPPAPLKAGVLDQAAGKALLTAAFGKLKTIDGGKMQVLAQADFQVAYDAVYGAGKFSWAKYVVPTFGNLEGFAHVGTNYINADIASADTVPHEMLHLNRSADFTATMGHEFMEGTTEYMTIHAMNTAGKTPTHSYPNQESAVQLAIAAGVSAADLFAAYLIGGTKTKVFDVIEAKCKGPAAAVVTDMEAKSWASAKARLAKKTP